MNNIIEKLNDSGIHYKIDEPMKIHTTFKTGGNAKIFVNPKNSSELSEILKICREEDIKPFILGNGSNLLVSDDGIDSVVIHMSDGFNFVRLVDSCTIEAGAGASLMSLCKFALENELTGLEFAFGIPGSVGGAAMMNAGAYGGEMKDVLFKCNHVSFCGERGSYNKDELNLSYRRSAYTDSENVITSVILKLSKGNSTEIDSKMHELLGRRKDKQPLDYPSAGSVFKRPEGYFAGALIEQSGLKGKSIGGAMVSEKHAGFIINYNNATTTDVINLIKFCQKTVYDKFKVNLETEIKMI